MKQEKIASSRETVYFVLSLIVSIIIYILAALSIVGIGILVLIFAVVFIMNIMMLGSIRGNGVKVTEGQFPEVYERVVEIATKMKLEKVPDIFVIESEGALNAFATRFWGRNMVVLYSEVFDLKSEQGKEELDFIIAHELSHVKRRHVWKNVLITPAKIFPFLSQAYSRSCEYTCDREAAYFTNNGIAAKRALTILSVGKKVYQDVNERAYMEQISSESHGAVWLSEIFSSHPNLPKRIQSVNVFMGELEQPVYKERPGKVFGGMLIIVLSMIVTYLLFFGSLQFGGAFYERLLLDWYEDETVDWDYNSWNLTNDGMSELMIAVNDLDIDEVNRLIEAGVDVNEQDEVGYTALHHSVYNYEITEILLEAGANPNIVDNNETSPLVLAVYFYEYDTSLLLLEYGADPSRADLDGDSALSWMEVETEEELYEALQNGQ
ncbi:hypothetical protein BTS2_1680 [Bacillus sp. TS-2]|nr:hypothetical protein BTS2_1680 [Bacillus sp. TS-2]